MKKYFNYDKKELEFQKKLVDLYIKSKKATDELKKAIDLFEKGYRLITTLDMEQNADVIKTCLLTSKNSDIIKNNVEKALKNLKLTNDISGQRVLSFLADISYAESQRRTILNRRFH